MIGTVAEINHKDLGSVPSFTEILVIRVVDKI